ncbi:VanZ family protein [Vibrio tritonius]|uniref:VanZ family protein n=1 Tax=Vibrio tritonius TaxID=1435069 RepID=UPI000837E364|nr:VanZ family protein [Vibrio tritonius]
MQQRVKKVALVGYTALIGYVSLAKDSSPDRVLPDLNSYGVTDLDKMAHLGAYTLFAVIAILALGLKSLKSIAICAAIIAVYSGVLEGLQTFVPLRETSWLDFFANNIGIILGSLLMQWWLYSPKAERNKWRN